MKVVLGKSWAVVSLFLIVSAGPAQGDFIFGEPTNLGPTVNSGSYDEAPSISADGLTLYFNSNRPGGYGAFDLWMTTRSTREGAWGPPENLGPTVNSSAREGGASISADGLSLYFNSTRPGGYGPVLWGDIWVTERATTSDPWGAPANLEPIVNSPSHAFGPSISYDGLSLFFGSDRAGESGNDDICVTTRTTTDGPWQEPVNLGPVVNSSAHDGGASVSSDGLALFFSGYAIAPYRSGGYGNADLWVTTRPTVSDSWGEPVNLGPTVNTSYYDFLPSISADGCTLYFMSDRPGGYGLWDLWQARLIPIVDFNSDGIIDIKDLVVLIESWGQTDPRCDVGPFAWGDGKVDAADLEVLMRSWGKPVDDPTLLAHWALDETEGAVAHDHTGANDGIVTGVPVWQPESGCVYGALELDGTTLVETEFVVSPSDGPFSVLAWVQGGAPGQVVIRQVDGANWLMADPSQGTLVTELAPPAGRKAVPPLVSESLITDGNWHRVAFVWNGVTRALYVDDALAAEDTQPSLASCSGGLNIGCGKAMTPGSFFAGLIDDVRIYNRAVKP